MFQESLNIHYLRGSRIRAAAAGVQQKVHGVLIAPYGRQLRSSQAQARPCSFMHNATQQRGSRCPWVVDVTGAFSCWGGLLTGPLHLKADGHPQSDHSDPKADMQYCDT